MSIMMFFCNVHMILFINVFTPSEINLVVFYIVVCDVLCDVSHSVF